MKVKSGKEIKNKNLKKFIEIFFLAKHFDIKEEDIENIENIKSIKIYSRSKVMFDSEKDLKNDTPVDSESNNIKD